MSTQQNSQKKLWIAAAAVWIIGILLVGGGGYIWWSRQFEPEPIVQVVEPGAVDVVDSVEVSANEEKANEVGETTKTIPTETPLSTPTATSEPTSTPESTVILSVAYIGEDGNLWLTDRLNEEQQLVASDGDFDNKISWSPDGVFLFTNNVLFNMETGEAKKVPPIGISRNNTHLRGVQNKLDDVVAWSPDGSMLAYVTTYKSGGQDGDFIPIKLVYLDTLEIETVEIGYRRDYKGHDHYLEQLFWTSNNNLFANVADYLAPTNDLYNTQLYRLSLEESKTFKPLLTDFTYIHALSVAPDNETLVFVGSKDELDEGINFSSDDDINYTLYQTSVSGSTSQKIAQLNTCHPCYTTWLSDGEGFYLYEQKVRSKTRTAVEMKLSFISWPSGEITNLGYLPGSSNWLSDVTLSPEGKTAAFQLYRADEDEISLYLLPSYDSELKEIVTYSGGRYNHLDYIWHPNGQELWLIDPEDENIVRIYGRNGDIIAEIAGLGKNFVLNPIITNDEQVFGQVIEDEDVGDVISVTDDITTTNTSSLAFANILPPTPTPTPTPTTVYIPPTATPVPACPNPGVQINSPAPGTTFYDRYVFVVGNANIANFHHYRIEYSTVNDGHSWNFLFENDYPVDNGKLMRLDTSTVPNGSYGLRLTVVDNTGNYPEPCEVWFYNGFW